MDKYPELHDSEKNVEGTLIRSEELQEFHQLIEGSIRRFERIVYPSLIILAFALAYGFFLQFNLSNDMRRIAESIDPNMGQNNSQIAESMRSIADDLKVLSKDLQVKNSGP